MDVKALKNLLFYFFLFLFVSCGHFKSGTYVRLSEDFTLADATKKFEVPEQAILSANQGKKMSPGEWIFIPWKRGVLHYKFVDENYNLIVDGQFLWPVPDSYKVSSFFGPRGRKHHDGIDIVAPRGTEIVAAEAGEVVYVGRTKGYGKVTVLKHDSGLFTLYAHASSNKTSIGQKVARGELIALVGNTGRSSGPHLHFEIRRNSDPKDPLSFLPTNLQMAHNSEQEN